jgi:hypothetical protein
VSAAARSTASSLTRTSPARRTCRTPALSAALFKLVFSCLQVLNGIITATNVPFSTYVPHPRTPLHAVDARLKQLWLLALLVLIPRLPWQARLGIVGCAADLLASRQCYISLAADVHDVHICGPDIQTFCCLAASPAQRRAAPSMYTHNQIRLALT